MNVIGWYLKHNLIDLCKFGIKWIIWLASQLRSDFKYLFLTFFDECHKTLESLIYLCKVCSDHFTWMVPTRDDIENMAFHLPGNRLKSKDWWLLNVHCSHTILKSKYLKLNHCQSRSIYIHNKRSYVFTFYKLESNVFPYCRRSH